MELVTTWPVDRAAAAVVAADGRIVATAGDIDAPFALASVTKLLTAAAVHLAVDEGCLTLEQAAMENTATVSDLLAHAAGIGLDGEILARPRTRRVYSNAGYDRLAQLVATSTGFSFPEYLSEGILRPARMKATELAGSPASGAQSTISDLARLVPVLTGEGILSAEAAARLRLPHLRDLAGVLPGYGRQEPNPWGLGPEIKGTKMPHWTGSLNSPTTFGHFGQSGTFWWFDPIVDTALIALSNRPFGPWCATVWPELSDAVVTEIIGRGGTAEIVG